MVERHYHAPHEVVCITDIPEGIDPRVRIVPLWDMFADIPSPAGRGMPSCYRRLYAFSPAMEQIIGPRFVSIDLDVVIVDDITPLWQRTEDFIIWRSPLRNTPYNGSMWMMDAGARARVLDEFDPRLSPLAAKRAGCIGSDQAWISYILGPNEASWGTEDGVYAFQFAIRNRGFLLPRDAKIVFFQGNTDPWDTFAREKAPWVLEHYR
jgi:hypothetical protein